MDFKDIKIVFFDVDGTLYSPLFKNVSEKTIKALKELKNNGVKICIATGRPKDFFDKLIPLFDGVEFDYYITSNGQAIFNENHEITYKNYLHPDDVKAIIKKANELDLCIGLVGEDYTLASKENDLLKASFEYLQVVNPQYCIIDEDFNKPVDNLICYEKLEYAKYFLPVIKHSVITHWTDTVFDFVPDNGVKVNGIKKVLNHLKLKPSQAMAFGDGQNDLDMLTYVGFGVAMKNASLNVQEAADYVCDHINDDGVYQALSLFKMI